MKSYSTEGQDIFAHYVCKDIGYFLDIGCAEPIHRNNTYYLESIGWTGLLFDYNQNNIDECKKFRKSKSFCLDVTKINWRSFLSENNCPKTIDYISLDVDKENINVIENFPFDEYEFKVMTIETDVYAHGSIIHDKAIRFMPKQYSMILENGKLNENDIWEDWWINEKYLSNKKWLYHKNKCWKDLINSIYIGKFL
jgi:hypothetical protein